MRIARYGLSAIGLCLVAAFWTAADVSETADKVLVSWDFSKAQDALGWEAKGEADLELKDGALWIITKGKREAIEGPDFELSTNSRQYFVIAMKNSRGRTPSIRWGVEGKDGELIYQGKSISSPRTTGAYTTCVVPEWEEGLVVRKLSVRSPYRAQEFGLVRVEIRERAEGGIEWLPGADISESSAKDGKVVATASGVWPMLVSPRLRRDASELGYATFRVSSPGAEAAQIFFKATPEEEFDISKSAFVELVGDGKPHTYVAKLKGLPGYRGNVERLALRLAEMEAGEKVEMEFFNAGEKPIGPADVWIEKFAVDPVIAPKGSQVTVRMWMRNTGGTESGKISATLKAEGTKVENWETDLGSLPPGGRRELKWTMMPEQEGLDLRVSGELVEEGKVVDEREARYVVTGTIDMKNLEVFQRGVTKSRVTDAGMAFAGNEKIAVYFPRSEYGYAPGFLMARKGEEWKLVGAWKGLGELVIQNDKGEAETHRFLTDLDGVDAYSEGYYSDLEVSSSWEDSDGKKWTVRHTFSVEGEERLVRLSTRLACSAAAKVLAYRPLVLLALGEERKLGFFPGLEYLLEGERSSGMEFVRYPFNNRLVPDPYKVTIPLMAVIREGIAVGMIWDPLQKWDGEHYLPNAMFASPNFVDDESDHLMTVFVPTQPEWADENSAVARVPYELSPDKVISLGLTLFAREGEDFDAVMDAYVEEKRTLPATPEMAYDYEEAIRAVMYEYTHLTFEKELAQWRRFLPDPRGPTYIPDRMLHLFWELKKGRGGDMRADMEEVFNYVMDKRNGDLGGAMVYYRGPLKYHVRDRRHSVEEAVSALRPDGTFGFVPQEEKHKLLGEPGDTSSGWTAQKLQYIWSLAVQTGDERAIEAGLKGIEYLDSQLRPEGAQTWELQLHVPDVLACPYAISCYLDAYLVTQDEKYLKGAVKWAYRGMPFVYLWNPPERPVMRYGTIPVFGGSWYKSGWFGKIVQWNGLRYAVALLELAEYDHSLDWGKVAKGIVDSAIAQQRPMSREGFEFAEYIPDCGHPGMFPDAYSATKGTDVYHWCLSGERILEVLYKVMGEDPSSKTRMIRKEGGEGWIAVSSVAYVEEPSFDGKALEMKLRMLPAITHYVAIRQLEEPKRVSVGEKELKAETELDDADEGYAYREDARAMVVKVNQAEERVHLRIEF